MNIFLMGLEFICKLYPDLGLELHEDADELQLNILYVVVFNICFIFVQNHNLMKTEPLEFGRYYHIYNHGVGNRDIFPLDENCEYFLELYMKYIVPIADTFAWALMKNHFHILLRLKDVEDVYPGVDLSGHQVKPPSRYFSNFFNAYAKAINKQTGMNGSLFRRPMKRKTIDGESYLKYLLLYIHTNPVHHDVCEFPEQFKWSSYNGYFSNQYSYLNWAEAVKWFDDKENMVYMHHKKIDDIRISKWLEIEE